MKIATWNVNSIRIREQRLLRWLEANAPDVVCLQELKVTEDAFPLMLVRGSGYHAVLHCQRTYNGVAILSRTEPKHVRIGLGDDSSDDQARLVSAEIGGVRVLSAYFPNGGHPKTFKYRYKLEWMRRMRAYLERHHDPSEPLALCGDFNVAPDDKDVALPDRWRHTVLCREDAREALERVRAWGLVDTFRKHYPDGGVYTWWDYRALAFPRDNGLRIDHVFATAPLAERTVAARADREERKGELPSDHVPVIVDIAE